MSKLKGILLLLIAAIVMGCASQPKQPKEEEPATQTQQGENASAEEKTAEPKKASEAQAQQVKRRFILLLRRIRLIRSQRISWIVLQST